MTHKTSATVQFEIVKGDPIQVHRYTLSNGLTLFISLNQDEPRVYTEIAVRAGSKHDPADTTGLAHYFEHMMFKGTDRLGSLDWPKEKALLDQIEQLYEKHRAEQDPEAKKAMYAEIDRLSFEAAGFAAANEYDKLVSAIGAKNTNAYTWVEQTVYVNDIPSNELERWFALESERFRRPVLRLFHTELETVFEEYNINQDRDFRKVIKALQENLTPTHPYGTQTTLGRGEDLKNPSQTNIYRFFDQYYAPNNMAIILCGDLDPLEVVTLAEKYFGHFEAKAIPPFHFEPQAALAQRKQVDVYGNEAAWIEIGWQFPGAKSEEAALLPLISGILYNDQAGLFDLQLIQQQQLLEAYAYPRVYEDYSSLYLHGKPREGQSLEQVEALLMQQVEALRKGHFEDWLPEAVTTDMKLGEIKDFEKNQGRANLISGAYILGLDWEQAIHRIDYLRKISKADIIAFAQKHLRDDNYVVVYKHEGPDTTVMKVEKPPITPVELNRTDASPFAQAFLAQSTPDIPPHFLDFKKTLKKSVLHRGIKLLSVHEPAREMFHLHYIFDMGRNSNRLLPLACSYLPFLGTNRYAASEMQQAFYKIGVQFSATCQDERLYLSLNGLDESLEAGIALMEHLLAEAQPNEEALQNLIADVLQRRENDKKDKRIILSKAMANYAKFGRHSAFTNKLTKEELLAVRSDSLIALIRSLSEYRHEVFYCGKRGVGQVAGVLKQQKRLPEQALPPLPAKKYREKGEKSNQVYVVDFPMVQVELLLMSKGTPAFNLQEYAMAEWYNQYFGYGLSSIVFQEIRESKALAYSAYAFSANPSRKNRAHYLQAYVGTQPDKLREAVDAFENILENMPVSLPQIEHARQSVLKQIAAGRITKSDIYWTWRNNRELGRLNQDLRQDVYAILERADATDLIRYHEQVVKGRRYTWMILGERSRLELDYLKKIGPLKFLTLEDIFGY